MAGAMFPKVMLLRNNDDDLSSIGYAGTVAYIDGSVLPTVDMYDPATKIEVETAKIDPKYIHIQFSESKKYWSANTEGQKFLVAVADEPNEDTSHVSCTLFEPVVISGGFINFVHVSSGNSLTKAVGESDGRYLLREYKQDKLSYAEWEPKLKLPQVVVFKGDNGGYLQVVPRDNNPYLQFSSNDPNSDTSGFQIIPGSGKYVHVYSNFNQKYWRVVPDTNWIVPDAADTSDAHTQFEPIKISDDTIALRTSIFSSSNFCTRFTTSTESADKINLFKAAAKTMVGGSRMQVTELVLSRKILGVYYRMDEAKISDETPYLAGQSVVVNTTKEEAVMAVEITYQDEKSYTFSRGVSVTAGVSTTIEAGVPFFAEGKIEVSFEITGSFQWDTTTTTTTSVTASASITVPPMSARMVTYVGTKGTVTIPYSYTQQDKRSNDGQVIHIPHDDGVYTGVGCYNFHFDVDDAPVLA